MLLEKIESLRKQPKSVRDQYAFATALGVTLVIALFWVVSLPSRLALPVATETTDPETSDFLDEFGQIQEIVGGELDTIQAQAELIGALATSTEVNATTTGSIIVATSSNVNDIFSDAPLSP